MNENLNLVEILKNCPKGTKLYSTIYGDVEFESINEDKSHPIIVRIDDDHTECFSIDGKIYSFYYGECVLFPSREQRDWGKFKLKCLKAADAEPNLASLWHDASEEPEGDCCDIIHQDENGCCWLESKSDIMRLYDTWNEFTEVETIIRWAYVSDLLPKGGEK